MKKSRFLAVLFSLIPGCGLMYLGYMKKGLQNMLLFVAAGYMAYFAQVIFFDWITVFFLFLLPVLWFYQMFDSMHSLTRMRKEEIEIPADDGFLFPEHLFVIQPMNNRTVAKAAAVVLITVGLIGILYGALNNLHYVIGWETQHWILSMVRSYLAPLFASLVLIIIGIRLLKGNKNNNASDPNENGEA